MKAIVVIDKHTHRIEGVAVCNGDEKGLDHLSSDIAPSWLTVHVVPLDTLDGLIGWLKDELEEELRS